ncbi:MAG: DNA replication/repair protein RecF [Actinobacteria bacterium]|nr:DNA replication/repair protein RecF [Actinomycetota bacterium]
MILRHLELTDLRSYRELDLTLEPGVTVLVGPNAHGKTNVLEALHRAATGSSHRVTGDTPLVRSGQDAAYVRVALETDAGRRRTVELELRPGRGSRARVDGRDVRRATDAIGVLRVVLFAPEDLTIVRDDPAQRRRFLDDLLSQRRPTFAATSSEYDRIVRQRNQLLRTLPSRAESPPTLAVWTEQLIERGATLTAARIAAVHALTGPTTAFYARIADQPEPIGLCYRSSAGFEVVGDPDQGVPEPAGIADRLRATLEDVAQDERDRGVTLVGPHRDDLDLSIRGLPTRGYASHGQTWSLALAMRLATYEVLTEVGDRPVMLLDDVFAELDDDRRERLAAACSEWEQVLVTAASERDVPLQGRMIDVHREGDVSHAIPRSPEGDGPDGR